MVLAACLLAAGLGSSARRPRKRSADHGSQCAAARTPEAGALPPHPPAGESSLEPQDPPGKSALFDTRLSADNTVSCATATTRLSWSDQGPDQQRDPRPVRRPPGAPRLQRRLQPSPVWDGRSPSLGGSGPRARSRNPIEMGNTHQAMIQTISKIADIRRSFNLVFGQADQR